MADDKLAAFLIKRIGRSEDRPVDRLVELLRKTPSKPTQLKHMPPDPSVTMKPDGPGPTLPKPKRKKYASPSP